MSGHIAEAMTCWKGAAKNVRDLELGDPVSHFFFFLSKDILMHINLLNYENLKLN